MNNFFRFSFIWTLNFSHNASRVCKETQPTYSNLTNWQLTTSALSLRQVPPVKQSSVQMSIFGGIFALANCWLIPPLRTGIGFPTSWEPDNPLFERAPSWVPGSLEELLDWFPKLNKSDWLLGPVKLSTACVSGVNFWQNAGCRCWTFMFHQGLPTGWK